jgi:hypothetical protein
MAKRKRTKGQKNKQRPTKHTHKAKDRATRTPLKTEVVNSGAQKQQVVPAPVVTPVVLL